ncbi:alpha/beta fold hydrolase [Caldimonas sp. KR1-144]|uniref:alpha/beta fold hydrolase n=1 Tax=Caldimonas sp. KR1-144 TaxID=3400911 RepID=UPI003BFBD128
MYDDPAPRASRALFLHCSGGNGRQWQPITAPLAGRIDCVAPELIGYGEGDAWRCGAALSLDDEVDRIAAHLYAHVEGVHLVGHSYGAAIALQAALRHPHQVRSLTLYEPVRFALLFGSPATVTAAREVIALGREVERLALAGELTASAERFVDYWSGAGAWAQMKPSRQQALAARMPKIGAEFDALFCDGTPAHAYRRLAMPVRLLAGERSPQPVRLIALRLAARLPNAELIAMPGLGHMGPLTHPQAVADKLPAWLAPSAPALAA